MLLLQGGREISSRSSLVITSHVIKNTWQSPPGRVANRCLALSERVSGREEKDGSFPFPCCPVNHQFI